MGIINTNSDQFQFQTSKTKTVQQHGTEQFVFQSVNSQGHGRGGEYTHTQCNGVGNINSPCQGSTHSVPEPGAGMLLALALVAVVAIKKFTPSRA